MRPILLLLATLAACTPPPQAATGICSGLRGDPGITARLYFGRTRTDSAAWQAFLAENVTPRFPAGFSVFDGYGQWQQRSTGRIIQEPSTIIEIAARRDPDTIWKFEEIRADYRTRFNQESVGLVVGESCVSF
jgi:hypothetical protein